LLQIGAKSYTKLLYVPETGNLKITAENCGNPLKIAE